MRGATHSGREKKGPWRLWLCSIRAGRVWGALLAQAQNETIEEANGRLWANREEIWLLGRARITGTDSLNPAELELLDRSVLLLSAWKPQEMIKSVCAAEAQRIIAEGGSALWRQFPKNLDMREALHWALSAEKSAKEEALLRSATGSVASAKTPASKAEKKGLRV